MISYFVFYTYSLLAMLPIIVWDIHYQAVGVWTLICSSIWLLLFAIKLMPTGALIPQYASFCKYRLYAPKDFLPKMSFGQIKSLLSIKELKADFDYVEPGDDNERLYLASYYNPMEKDVSSAFVICSVKDNNENEVYVNPATYLDYFRMCLLIKRRGRSICIENTTDAQLENLNAIRDVLRGIQDEEVAKMQDIASENKTIESRILNDGKVKVKIK